MNGGSIPPVGIFYFFYFSGKPRQSLENMVKRNRKILSESTGMSENSLSNKDVMNLWVSEAQRVATLNNGFIERQFKEKKMAKFLKMVKEEKHMMAYNTLYAADLEAFTDANPSPEFQDTFQVYAAAFVRLSTLFSTDKRKGGILSFYLVSNPIVCNSFINSCVSVLLAVIA